MSLGKLVLSVIVFQTKVLKPHVQPCRSIYCFFNEKLIWSHCYFETVQSILLEYQALWTMALATSSNGSDICGTKSQAEVKGQSSSRIKGGSDWQTADRSQALVCIESKDSSKQLYVVLSICAASLQDPPVLYLYYLFYIAWCDKRFHFWSPYCKVWYKLGLGGNYFHAFHA